MRIFFRSSVDIDRFDLFTTHTHTDSHSILLVRFLILLLFLLDFLCLLFNIFFVEQFPSFAIENVQSWAEAECAHAHADMHKSNLIE